MDLAGNSENHLIAAHFKVDGNILHNQVPIQCHDVTVVHDVTIRIRVSAERLEYWLR